MNLLIDSCQACLEQYSQVSRAFWLFSGTDAQDRNPLKSLDVTLRFCWWLRSHTRLHLVISQSFSPGVLQTIQTSSSWLQFVWPHWLWSHSDSVTSVPRQSTSSNHIGPLPMVNFSLSNLPPWLGKINADSSTKCLWMSQSTAMLRGKQCRANSQSIGNCTVLCLASLQCTITLIESI